MKHVSLSITSKTSFILLDLADLASLLLSFGDQSPLKLRKKEKIIITHFKILSTTIKLNNIKHRHFNADIFFGHLIL